jgi:hypothetical protein
MTRAGRGGILLTAVRFYEGHVQMIWRCELKSSNSRMLIVSRLLNRTRNDDINIDMEIYM